MKGSITFLVSTLLIVSCGGGGDTDTSQLPAADDPASVAPSSDVLPTPDPVDDVDTNDPTPEPAPAFSPRLEVDGQIYETTDYLGNARLFGLLKNTGERSAIFVTVRCNFFDANSLLVEDSFTFVKGSNLLLISTDATTNTALKPGYVGVFEVSTFIDSSDYATYECKYSYDLDDNTREPDAKLELLGLINVQGDFSDDVEYLGRVENTGTKGLIFGQVYVVTRDTSDSIVDVSSTFVSGDTVTLASINRTTDTALDLGSSGTFTIPTSVPFATYGQHSVFLSWDDSEISNGTARSRNAFSTIKKMRNDFLGSKK